MAEPAKIDLNTVKRGDTYIVDFYFSDTDGTKDISAVTIDAQARREMDGALWFDLKPVKVDASNGHFRIHLTHDETRAITEAPSGSFSGIYDIQFSWQGASEVYVSTIVAGSISISKDVTQPVSLSTSGSSPMVPPSSQEVSVYLSLNPGTPNYSDVVTAEQLTPVQYDLSASLGLANVNAINEAGEAARAAEKFAAEALASKNSARQSEQIATIQATKATSEAAKAEKAAKDAVAVVTGGDATLVPTPGKIPLANAKGKIDEGWFSATLMTEAEARAIQAHNLERFDASGFVNMGRVFNASTYEAINEGLYVRNDNVNYTDQVYIGASASNALGSSKTGHAVTHIAGSIINLLNVDNGDKTWVDAAWNLPPAPDGTDIYDSTGNARGSGKAALNLKTDIDPKYGNVPAGTANQILEEAVLRAFGEQRWDPEEISNGGDTVVDHSTKTATTTGSAQGVVFSKVPLDRDTVTMKVSSITQAKYMEIRDSSGSGSATLLATVTLKEGLNTVDLKELGETRTTEHVYLRQPGGGANTIVFDSVSITKSTEQVVTHPSDLVALEYYEEETDGEIFEDIQNMSPKFGLTNVPTVLSKRKLSYFQQYDGQFPEVVNNPNFINDRYRCVVWQDLTDEQQREVSAYMGEKLFMGVNGKMVNGRLRARTVRGLGDGDWDRIDTAISGVYLDWRKSNPTLHLRPQGARDTAISEMGSGYPVYSARRDGSVEHDVVQNTKGVFGAMQSASTSDTDAGYQGRCFLYVVATVPRANQGAFVYGVNEYGTATPTSPYTSQNIATNLSGVAKVSHIYELKDCFMLGNGYGDDFIAGRYADTGTVGSSSTYNKVRQDDVVCDGIEAGGLNGVVDWRLGAIANDSPEEAAKVEAKVEDGTYRGLEKLVSSKVIITDILTSGDSAWVQVDNTDGYIAVGSKLHSVRTADNLVTEHVVKSAATGGNVIQVEPPLPSRNAGDQYYLVAQKETNLSVSGEFDTKMVIGDPASILKTDAVKNGWLGTWCPAIPDGTNKDYEFSRKLIGGDLYSLHTTDFGTSWSAVSRIGSFDKTKNSLISQSYGTDRVLLCYYGVFAKQTKPSENKLVYNGKAGLIGVFIQSDEREIVGSLLTESLLGKVPKNKASTRRYTSCALDTVDIYKGVIQAAYGYEPTHIPWRSDAPTNNSPAVKVLPYQISNDGKGSIGYQANELTWGSPTFKDADTTVTAVLENEIYYITSSAGSEDLLGHTVRVMTDNTGIDWSNYSVINGVVCSKITKIPSGVLELWNGSLWGDDGKIKITEEGSGTFKDQNGNTNLQVVHELAIPYTWTSNRARSGPQVPGVDL